MLDYRPHPLHLFEYDMSSFVKKNPRLSGILKTEDSKEPSVPSPSSESKTGIPGLFPSLSGSSTLLASSGIPDLDVCLGGGLPPGSIMTFFEDFPSSKANFTWSGPVRCFLAETLATASLDYSRKDGGWMAVVGHDINGILSALPKPELSSINSISKPERPDNANDSSKSSDKSMQIAWRYEGLKEFNSNLKRPISAISGSNEKSIGHTFDLGRKHEGCPKQLLETSRVLELDLSKSSSEDPENNLLRCDYQRAWKFIKESIQTNQRSGLGRIVIGSLGSSSLWNCSCSISCGPAWLVKSVANLVQEIEPAQSCLVLVTVPVAYFIDQPVIPGLFDSKNNINILPTWIAAVENVSDAVIELKPIAGLSFKSEKPSSSKLLIAREYDGFLVIRKSLRRPNSFKPFIPETSNLAFKIKRRRFVIEKFHLPPALENDQAASEPSTLCSSGKPDLSSKTNHPLDF